MRPRRKRAAAALALLALGAAAVASVAHSAGRSLDAGFGELLATLAPEPPREAGRALGLVDRDLVGLRLDVLVRDERSPAAGAIERVRIDWADGRRVLGTPWTGAARG